MITVTLTLDLRKNKSVPAQRQRPKTVTGCSEKRIHNGGNYRHGTYLTRTPQRAYTAVYEINFHARHFGEAKNLKIMPIRLNYPTSIKSDF